MLRIWGEDDDPDEDTKPVRVINDFCVFDPVSHYNFLSLEEMDSSNGTDRHFEAAGYVGPKSTELSDEDYGQEDEEEYGQYLHLGALLRWSPSYEENGV